MFAAKNMLVGAWATCLVDSSFFLSLGMAAGGFFRRSSCFLMASFICRCKPSVSISVFSYRDAVGLHACAYFLVFFWTPMVNMCDGVVCDRFRLVG